MFRLNEDMPEYHRRMPAGWAAKDRMAGQNANYDGPFPHTLADWFREQAMTRLTRHVQYAARSPWSRVVGGGSECPPAGGFPLGPLSTWGAPFLSWCLPTPAWDHCGRRENAMVAQWFAVFPTMIVLPQMMGWLMMRTRTLGYEVMLPVDRRLCAATDGSALATSYFALCGVTRDVVLGTRGRRWPPPLGYVGSLVAACRG